jgi:hypothetical protein
MRIQIKNSSNRKISLKIKDCGNGEISISRTNQDKVKDFDLHLVQDGTDYAAYLFNSKIKKHDDAFIRQLDPMTLGEAIDYLTNLSAKEALGD